MLRELLIQERVVCGPEFDRVAVVTQLTEQEQIGFLRERITQGYVVIGEILLVRIGIAELIEFQPGEEKSRHEGLGTIVGNHSLDLALKYRGIAQAVVVCVVQQRSIGSAVPQQGRKA